MRRPLGGIAERLTGSPSPAALLLFLVALTLGVFLRVEGLGRKSLWVDEVSIHLSMAHPTLGDLIGEVRRSPQGPLYYTTLWVWTRAWGRGEVAIRAFSVVLGLMAFPAIYFMWRSLIGRGAAAWALVLLALNAYHVEYSRDAKEYSAVWLLAIISSGAFLNALRIGQNRMRWLVAYGVSTGCLLLVSNVGVATLAAQVFYGSLLAWRHPERRRAVFSTGIAVWVGLWPFLLLWLPVSLRAATDRTGIRWIPAAKWEQAPADLYRLVGNFLLGYRYSGEAIVAAPDGVIGKLLANAYGPCVVGAAGLIIAYLIGGRRGSQTSSTDVDRGVPAPVGSLPLREVVTFLTIWFTFPVVATLGFSLTIFSLWGVPRYLSGAAPALLLWLAVGLHRFRPRALAIGLGVAVLVVNLAAMTFSRTYCTRTPYRAMARVIRTATEGALTDRGRQDLRRGSRSLRPAMAITRMPDHPVVIECLTYALGRENLDPPSFVTFDDALRRRKPFLLAMEVYLDPGQPNVARRELDRRAQGFACQRIFSRLVFQEPYTAIPSPSARYSAEVWLCTPRKAVSHPDQGDGDDYAIEGCEKPADHTSSETSGG